MLVAGERLQIGNRGQTRVPRLVITHTYNLFLYLSIYMSIYVAKILVKADELSSIYQSIGLHFSLI